MPGWIAGFWNSKHKVLGETEMLLNGGKHRRNKGQQTAGLEIQG